MSKGTTNSNKLGYRRMTWKSLCIVKTNNLLIRPSPSELITWRCRTSIRVDRWVAWAPGWTDGELANGARALGSFQGSRIPLSLASAGESIGGIRRPCDSAGPVDVLWNWKLEHGCLINQFLIRLQATFSHENSSRMLIRVSTKQPLCTNCYYLV